MIVPGSLNAMMYAAGDPCEAYKIAKSVRFNAGNSPVMQRTLAAPTAQKRWTLSLWHKRAVLGATQVLFEGAIDANNRTHVYLTSDDALAIVSTRSGVVDFIKISTAKFRDPAAHMHIVVSADMDAATAEDRIRLEVNGNRVTQFSTNTNPSAGYANGLINAAQPHALGRGAYSGGGQHLNGLLSDVIFVDGQALGATAFGFICPGTGQWRPKRYVGTFGANGFWLRFNDGSAATAAALGADRSGNGNNMTPVGIGVAYGAGCDWLDDTTSNNYTVWNPLHQYPANGVSNGGLDLQTVLHYAATAPDSLVHVDTLGMFSGKYLAEFSKIAGSESGSYRLISVRRTGVRGSEGENRQTTVAYRGNGQKIVSGSATSYGSAWNVGDVITACVDADAKTVNFHLNGVPQGAISIPFDGPYYFSISDEDSGEIVQFKANFGQQPQSTGQYYSDARGWFRYAPPAGYKALCSKNLPRPAIIHPRKFFAPKLWTGNGSAQSIVGLDFSPALTWIKSRSNGAASHKIFDAVRGALNSLSSDARATEAADSDSLSAFNPTGFTLGANANVNQNAGAFASWNWKEGALPGFDIVTYAGNGAARNISHALGLAPKLLIVKGRQNTGSLGDWYVWHAALAGNEALILNLTAAKATVSSAWNSLPPNSASFSLGTLQDVNANGVQFVAYLFAEIPGFSRFGSYRGHANADGPFVDCGFRPAFILIKSATSSGNWKIYDTAREAFNQADASLAANLPNAEDTAVQIDVVSNGFKPRVNHADINAQQTYVFAAFAEAPMKYANAR